MIYLLLGQDSFGKKEFIEQLRSKNKAELLVLLSPDILEIERAANEQNLFAAKKIIIISDLLDKVDFAQLLEKIKNSKEDIVFQQESLDKRKTETKKILADKNLNVFEFEIPSGVELVAWVRQKSQQIDLKFEPDALNVFLERIGANQGGFGEPAYDLWQVNSELQKLKIFAAEKPVNAEDIRQLVAENIDEDIFKITNAIADQNKNLTVKYLTDYIDRIPGNDEKSKIISLSGIIAEQFRGIYMLQNMLQAGDADAEIARASGFSSGKLFIYKKLAQRFSTKKILDTLHKLEMLDVEIKTSSGPAALQFFMIINSLMAG